MTSVSRSPQEGGPGAPWAAALRRLLSPVLELPGSLLIVPVAVLLLGSQWTLERRLEPGSARLDDGTAIPTYLVPEGSQEHAGIQLEPGASLTFDLPSLRHPFTLEVQGFSRDRYRVSVSAGGERFEELWTIPPAGQRGFRTHGRSFDAPDPPIRHLRLTAAGREGHRLAGIRLDYTAAVFDHLVLIPVLWGCWLLLVAARRLPALAPAANGVLSGWRRSDPWLATILLLLVLFRPTPELVLVGAAAALLYAAVRLLSKQLRRAPLATALYVAFLGVLFLGVLPWAVGALAAKRAGLFFDLTVDHRMRPDGDEINSDGLRFRGEPADLDEDDFVLLVLGDSFTYGLGLDYPQSYPYVLERLLAARDCAAPPRAVNFGWGSSSPLLSLRLLRDVGADYHPDLVLYTLDATDFHDDLRYERELRAAGDLEIDHRKVARELAAALLSRLPLLAELPATFARLRRGDPEAAGDGAGVPLPRDRFFVTSAPLEETRPLIERGVMRNLAAIHAFARDELGAPMALVLYPRAYQYSARESPRNWERFRYRKLGPHVREPFRYFREVAGELPYPVFDLLPDFERASEFPLFFDDDPHWNAAGARLAAAAVAERLLAERLVPCAPD